MTGETSRRRPEPFRPRFTIMILYLAFFFFLFGMLLAVPDLMEVIQHAGTLPEAELRARSEQITQRSLGGGRIYLALAAAAVSVGLGAWQRALPGLR
jgi:hypothetical protein